MPFFLPRLFAAKAWLPLFFWQVVHSQCEARLKVVFNPSVLFKGSDSHNPYVDGQWVLFLYRYNNNNNNNTHTLSLSLMHGCVVLPLSVVKEDAPIRIGVAPLAVPQIVTKPLPRTKRQRLLEFKPLVSCQLLCV